ncbi:MAG: hypothetical protein ABW190_15525 [Rhizobacter sp.]
MMKKFVLVAALASACGLAQAQQSPSVSVGLRAWHTQWDTFSYTLDQFGNSVVIQAPAKDKLVMLPVLSARWHDFTASLSLYPSTDHEFVNGDRGTRKEFDLNLGYYVTPGVAVTAGFKKIEQRGGSEVYALDGPVIGIAGTAPLGRDFSLYGSFGMGWMKSTGSSTVKFDADYRLSEIGAAYTLPTSTFVKAVTFTLGYRTQVLTSKEALGNQDARDLTQGFTFGAIATF